MQQIVFEPRLTISSVARSSQEASQAPAEELVDSILTASRALVAVAARSLAQVADDVTLPQYRALIEIAATGPSRPADLADALGVDRSSATRMCDRLVRRGLISRRRLADDRRSVHVSLTKAGRALVADVTQKRRAEIAKILERMPASDRDRVNIALRVFADAAGEVADERWTL